MNDISLSAQTAAWRGALTRTGSICATYYARRLPHWIAIGSRVWAEQREPSPLAGRGLADELMQAARREVEFRGEFTRRMLTELAERHAHLPSSQVLVDCTKLAGELMREGCRDVDKDIERSSRFIHGVDADAAAIAISHAITRITDHLLSVISARTIDL